MTNYKKTVLITGASRGIGRACAVELARTGHALVLNSRRPSAEMDETVRLCEEAGAEVRTLFFDVGSTEAARTAIEADIAANGAYWGVVLNAGVTCDNAFPALEEEDWKRVIDVDLNGFYNVIHPAVMPMVRARKGGRIVTMSSVSGVTGNPARPTTAPPRRVSSAPRRRSPSSSPSAASRSTASRPASSTRAWST